MRKQTTIDIDVDLLARAAAALGTTSMIDTIHAALSEVVRHRFARGPEAASADRAEELEVNERDRPP